MKHTLVFALLLVTACSTAPAPAPAAAAAAGPDEFDIKATVLAAYNVISGPAGRRDWDRFKELFAPGGRVVHVMPDGSLQPLSTDDFVTIAKPFFDKDGLFEHPTATRVQREGNVATVLSAFESRHKSDDAQPFQTGVDAIELVRMKNQWKIASITRTTNP